MMGDVITEIRIYTCSLNWDCVCLKSDGTLEKNTEHLII